MDQARTTIRARRLDNYPSRLCRHSQRGYVVGLLGELDEGATHGGGNRDSDRRRGPGGVSESKAYRCSPDPAIVGSASSAGAIEAKRPVKSLPLRESSRTLPLALIPSAR